MFLVVLKRQLSRWLLFTIQYHNNKLPFSVQCCVFCVVVDLVISSLFYLFSRGFRLPFIYCPEAPAAVTSSHTSPANLLLYLFIYTSIYRKTSTHCKSGQIPERWSVGAGCWALQCVGDDSAPTPMSSCTKVCIALFHDRPSFFVLRRRASSGMTRLLRPVESYKSLDTSWTAEESWVYVERMVEMCWACDTLLSWKGSWTGPNVLAAGVLSVDWVHFWVSECGGGCLEVLRLGTKRVPLHEHNFLSSLVLRPRFFPSAQAYLKYM